MTMCPYKWFLYIASLWAVVYVMLEAFMQYRAVNEQLQKPGFESVLNEPDSDEDVSDDEEEAEKSMFDGSVRRREAALQR